MNTRKKTKTRSPEARVNIPLSMTGELAAKVAATAEKVKLSQQDVMRLSIDRGLSVLEAQLTGEPVAA